MFVVALSSTAVSCANPPVSDGTGPLSGVDEDATFGTGPDSTDTGVDTAAETDPATIDAEVPATPATRTIRLTNASASPIYFSMLSTVETENFPMWGLGFSALGGATLLARANKSEWYDPCAYRCDELASLGGGAEQACRGEQNVLIFPAGLAFLNVACELAAGESIDLVRQMFPVSVVKSRFGAADARQVCADYELLPEGPYRLEVPVQTALDTRRAERIEPVYGNLPPEPVGQPGWPTGPCYAVEFAPDTAVGLDFEYGVDPLPDVLDLIYRGSGAANAVE